MFESARLKLTAWYLLIIMIISIIFSIAIYRGATFEVERSLRNQRFRLYRETHPFQFPQQITIDPQLISEANERIKISLILVNLGIFVVAGGAAYFLAGRTLSPIAEMVDEQNRFITDASHELRTPLTSLKSEIEVFLRGKRKLEKETTRLLQSNLEEVNHLQQLSDNLLQLAQFKKTNGDISLSNTQIYKVINAALKKLASQIRHKNINVRHDIDKKFEVLGDEQSLVQLFVVLLDNAVKYSEKGKSVFISSAVNDSSLFITIKDEGPGIDKKDIPHIFDRFYRADSSRAKYEVQGYGLGLSIAKKIAEQHNGDINVSSEKGKGAVFTVRLPQNV